MDAHWTVRLLKTVALVVGVVLALGIGTLPVVAQQLPPPIEADRLLLLAEQQMLDEDFSAALSSLDQILELATEYDLELPEPFWFNHARVALEARRPQEARASAIRYLEITGQGGQHYIEALDLVNAADELLAMPAEERAALEAWSLVAPEGTLVPGQSIRGRLSPGDAIWNDGAHYDKWRVELGAGQLLVMAMDSDDVDAYLMVVGVDRTILATDDDGGEGTNALLQYAAPSSGVYFIVARHFGSRPESGSYSLRWGR